MFACESRCCLRVMTRVTVTASLAVLASCGGGGGGSDGQRQRPPPAIGAFEIDPPYPWIGKEVTLRARCSGTAPVTYDWSFGDNSTASTTAESVLHTYGETGSYTVNVTCRDASGSAQAPPQVIDVYGRDLRANAAAECTGGYAGHGWCLQRPRADGPLFRTVVALDADTLWGIGSSGSVVRANSDGTSSSRLHSVRLFETASPSVAWAVHAGGLSYTRDGERGADAQWASVPNAPASLRQISAVDTNTVWVQDIDRHVWRSTNGGDTWSRVTTAPIDRAGLVLFARSAEQAWIVGASGLALRTADGGRTWQSAGPAGSSLPDLVAAGMNAARTQAWIAAGDGSVYLLDLQSAAWTQVRALSATERFLAVSVRDDVVWLAGYAITNAAAGARRARLLRGVRDSDGVLTWFPVTVGSDDQALTSVSAFTATDAWTAGRSHLFKAARINSFPNSSVVATARFSLQDSTDTLHAFDAVTELTAWAAGSNNALLRTLDGGVTWSAVPGAPASFDALVGFGALLVWGVAREPATAQLYKSNDGGQTWATQTPGTATNALRAIARVPIGAGQGFGQQVVWLAGDGGTLLRTSDGGSTWAALPCPANVDFRDIAARSQATAWAIGVSALDSQTRLYKVTDSSCQPTTIPDSTRVLAVAMSSEDQIWALTSDIANQSLRRLWRTTDGAATWKDLNLAAQVANTRGVIASNVPGFLWLVTRTEMWKLSLDRDGQLVARQQALREGSSTALSKLQTLNAVTLWGVGDSGVVWKTLTGGDYVGGQGPKPAQVIPPP
jgi:photosystem II stability/assembly factor-like uncharacterized protein